MNDDRSEWLWRAVQSGSNEGLAWVRERVEDVTRDPSSIVRPFASARRKVGADAVDDGHGVYRWTIDEAARVLLLQATGDSAWNFARDLYEHGDSYERRGVLRALPYLPRSEEGMTLVHDAIRSNEATLVVAALSSYALERLSEGDLNQAVLKCVFLEIPLDEIDGLADRANPAMARMLGQLARERVAAGRDVADDIWPLVNSHPPIDVLSEIESDLEAPVETRRQAAERALAALRAVTTAEKRAE